jgi:hypothetical protein
MSSLQRAAFNISINPTRLNAATLHNENVNIKVEFYIDIAKFLKKTFLDPY